MLWIRNKTTFLISLFGLLTSGLHADSEKLNLSLSEAITLALAKNYNVKYQSLAPQIAQQRVRYADGDFDPTVGVNYGATEFDNQLLSNEETTSRTTTLYVNGRIPLGTQYRLSISSIDQNQNTGEQTTIQVTQPLLRGFGRNENTAIHQISKKNLEIEQWRFKETLMDTVQNVVHLYADLYLAMQSLSVAQENQDLAKKLLEDNQKRVALGKNAQADMILAESRFASRTGAVINAKRAVHVQENRFKLTISNEIQTLFNVGIFIAPLPNPIEQEIDILGDFKKSLLARPDFNQIRIRKQIREISARRDRSRIKPQLDWVGRYIKTDSMTDTPIQFQSHQPQSGHEFFSGIELSMPIPNRKNNAQHLISKFELEQAEIDQERYNQQVFVSIDNAGFQVTSDWNRMLASRKTKELVKKSLQAEEKKLRAGTSRSFFVLDLQERLANAQIQEIFAQVNYFKSLVNYERERGTILETYQVKFDR